MSNIPVREMIKNAVEEMGGKVSKTQIIQWISEKYGDVNHNTIRTQANACSVNQPSRIHLPECGKPRPFDSRYDFLFNTGDGKVELYDSKKHGNWELVEHEGKTTISKDGVPIVNDEKLDYFLLRHSQKGKQKQTWIDEIGEKYHVGRYKDGRMGHNVQKLLDAKVGTKAVWWSDAIDGIPYILGYGTIKSFETLTADKDWNVVFDDFVMFEKDRKTTGSIGKEVSKSILNQIRVLEKESKLNWQHSINTIPKKLYQEMISNESMTNDEQNDLTFDDPEVKKILKVFENTKNVILYGPPGTGKTRMANIIKEYLLQGNSTLQTAYDKNPTWKSVSALVLLENKCEALHYQEIAKRASKKKLKLTGGKTPEETLRRDISQDIHKNNQESIFRKSGDGIYGLNTPTTFLNAAKIILFAYNRPMHYDEITKIAIENRIVMKPENPEIIPEEYMNQSLSQEYSKNGENSIFEKIDGGSYSLRSQINNSQNNKNPKIALCFPSKGDGETNEEKTKRLQEEISESGYRLWGMSNISNEKISKKDFPIIGYLCENQKIFAKTRISDIIKTEELEGSEKKDWQDSGFKVVLKIEDIALCKPFEDNKLLKWDDQSALNSKNMSNFAYVQELRDDLNISKNNFRFVTFHPSFAYEDFLEGIRPVTKNEGKENETIGYERQDGIFKEICEIARNNNEKYLLIIDEINRGNISKIFGELITLIEDDKRGNQLDLVYSKKPFSVPENLYILGTMNTADKSLVQIDTALRRRFAFVEMMPNSEMKEIKEAVVEGIPIKNLMDKLNDNIREEYRDKQIGHSYFLKIKDIETLHFIFMYKIIPLLQDYFYGDYEILSKILGDQIISKDKKSVNEKIINSPEELKNALLKWLEKNDENEPSGSE